MDSNSFNTTTATTPTNHVIREIKSVIDHPESIDSLVYSVLTYSIDTEQTKNGNSQYELEIPSNINCKNNINSNEKNVQIEMNIIKETEQIQEKKHISSCWRHNEPCKMILVFSTLLLALNILLLYFFH